MKKNLLVVLVVGLMVALLGAPAFAAGHEGGHVDEDDFVVISMDTVSVDQGANLEIIGLDVEEVEDAIESEDVVFGEGPQEGDYFEIFGACEVSGDAVSDEVAFTMNDSGLDGTAPYAESGDEMLYPLTESGDAFVAAAAPKIRIADGSWADKDGVKNGSVKSTVGFVKEASNPDDDSSGGGCDLASIAPMAGLLVLPLIMLVKR